MPQYITVNELKAYPLPVTDKQWEKVTDEQIQKVIEYATQNIIDYIDRELLTATYVERVQGNGRSKIVLNHYPVTSITGITSTDVYGSTTVLSPSAFIISGDAGIIEWVDKYRNRFWSGLIYSVTYTAGYAVVPGPVKHAVALQTVQMLQPLFRGGVNFNQIDLIADTNEQIVDLLEKYKRKRIG